MRYIGRNCKLQRDQKGIINRKNNNEHVPAQFEAMVRMESEVDDLSP